MPLITTPLTATYPIARSSLTSGGGDGGDTATTLTDPVAGHDLVGDHTYARPGAYTITVTVNVTAGPCTGTNSVHAFTLLAPPLPAQSTPAFVCVTGPGSTCLQRGAGVPKPGTWDPVPSAWLTSPVVAGCGLSIVELLVAIAAPEADLEWLVLVEALMPGAAIPQSLFQRLLQPVSKSQLRTLGKLPFLR
jgi:hypothetical protein